MAKVTINGQIFDYDPTRKPLFEALEIERGLKCRYADWENELVSDEGASIKALTAFVWLIWHRDGRDVSLEDILSGKVEVNLNGLTIEPDEGTAAADPTPPGSTPPIPEASPTTGTSTSAPSRKSSASSRGSSDS